MARQRRRPSARTPHNKPVNYLNEDMDFPPEKGPYPGTPANIDVNELDSLIADLYSDREWLKVPIVFVHMLGPQLALLMAMLYLVRYSAKTRSLDAGRPFGEWFYYTQTRFERDFNVSIRNQRKQLAELKRIGFIEIEMKGFPSMRYIQINHRLIYQEAKKASAKVNRGKKTKHSSPDGVPFIPERDR